MVDSFDVIGVRSIYLQSDVFDGVFSPERKFVGADHHERKGEFHQNSADMFLTLLSGVLLLDGDINKSQRTVKRFCTHELSSAC